MSVLSKLRSIGNYTVATLSFGTIASWWSGGFRNAETIFANEKPDVAAAPLPDSVLKRITAEAKEDFKDITFIYAYHGKQSDLNTLTPKELDNIKDKMAHTEVLDFCDLPSGLRAAALKDSSGIAIVVAGADFANKKALWSDIDDVGRCTNGSLGNQFYDLYNFSKKVEKEHGKIDNFIGHSLGGYEVTCMAPGFPDAKVMTFDAPGMQFNTIHNLGEFYNVSDSFIRKVTRDNVTRIKPEENVFNTLGSVGIDLSMTDPKTEHYNAATSIATFMHKHIYTGPVEDMGHGFYNAVNNPDMKLYQTPKGADGYGAGPAEITGFLALAGLAAVYFERRKQQKKGKHESKVTEPDLPDGVEVSPVPVRG